MTDFEKADLLFLREEEKLARDIYTLLYREWGLAIFDNITPSEQNHMDTVKKMIDRHQLSEIDPVILQPEPGLFVHQYIQTLYYQLAEKGSLSETDAIEVGVIFEETDIEDIELFLTRVESQDIINTYLNLMSGSYNHLSAFQHLLP